MSAADEEVNVKVVSDGKYQWKIVYETMGDMTGPQVDIVPGGDGFVVRFRTGNCSHVSNPIPDRPVKSSQTSSGKNKFTVKIQCQTTDLDNYF